MEYDFINCKLCFKITEKFQCSYTLKLHTTDYVKSVRLLVLKT